MAHSGARRVYGMSLKCYSTGEGFRLYRIYVFSNDLEVEGGYWRGVWEYFFVLPFEAVEKNLTRP